MNNGKYITIQEASLITGKHITTFYKGIRQGRIQYKTVEENARQVKKVLKEDIIKLYYGQVEDGIRPSIRPSNTKVEDGITLSKEDIRAEMKEVIESYFQDRETKLMKPLEELATYRVGQLEERVKNLEKEKELILLENEELRASIKALPGPVGEIAEKIKLQEDKILELEGKTAEQEQQIRDKQNEGELLWKAKQDLQVKQNLKEQEIEKLKATIKNQAEEAREKDDIIRQQKDHFQNEEKDYIATIEILKMKLEEEQKKPWWKFW